MRPFGVIFDMDGVLVASGPAHLASWRMLARRHGLDLSEDKCASLFGRPSRDIIRELWGNVSDERVVTLDDEKESIYRGLVTGLLPLTIGARETLEALSAADITLAVATSAPPENLNLVLKEGRLERYFTATVHGFDVTHGKPAPDCYLLAARRAELNRDRCVVVEDALAGITAGRSAGMKVVGLVGTHSADRLAAHGVDRVVHRLAELTPSMVRELVEASS